MRGPVTVVPGRGFGGLGFLGLGFFGGLGFFVFVGAGVGVGVGVGFFVGVVVGAGVGLAVGDAVLVAAGDGVPLGVPVGDAPAVGAGLDADGLDDGVPVAWAAPGSATMAASPSAIPSPRIRCFIVPPFPAQSLRSGA